MMTTRIGSPGPSSGYGSSEEDRHSSTSSSSSSYCRRKPFRSGSQSSNHFPLSPACSDFRSDSPPTDPSSKSGLDPVDRQDLSPSSFDLLPEFLVLGDDLESPDCYDHLLGLDFDSGLGTEGEAPPGGGGTVDWSATAMDFDDCFDMFPRTTDPEEICPDSVLLSPGVLQNFNHATDIFKIATETETGVKCPIYSTSSSSSVCDEVLSGNGCVFTSSAMNNCLQVRGDSGTCGDQSLITEFPYRLQSACSQATPVTVGTNSLNGLSLSSSLVRKPTLDCQSVVSTWRTQPPSVLSFSSNSNVSSREVRSYNAVNAKLQSGVSLMNAGEQFEGLLRQGCGGSSVTGPAVQSAVSMGSSGPRDSCLSVYLRQMTPENISKNNIQHQGVQTLMRQGNSFQSSSLNQAAARPVCCVANHMPISGQSYISPCLEPSTSGLYNTLVLNKTSGQLCQQNGCGRFDQSVVNNNNNNNNNINNNNNSSENFHSFNSANGQQKFNPLQTMTSSPAAAVTRPSDNVIGSSPCPISVVAPKSIAVRRSYSELDDHRYSSRLPCRGDGSEDLLTPARKIPKLSRSTSAGHDEATSSQFGSGSSKFGSTSLPLGSGGASLLEAFLRSPQPLNANLGSEANLLGSSCFAAQQQQQQRCRLCVTSQQRCNDERMMCIKREKCESSFQEDCFSDDRQQRTMLQRLLTEKFDNRVSQTAATATAVVDMKRLNTPPTGLQYGVEAPPTGHVMTSCDAYELYSDHLITDFGALGAIGLDANDDQTWTPSRLDDRILSSELEEILREQVPQEDVWLQQQFSELL